MPRAQLIRFRRGTTAQWNAADPVLADGEPGWDSTADVFKVGDGVTPWSGLAGVTGTGGGGPVSWASVTGKPTTFPPSPHGHTAGDVEGLTAALAAAETPGGAQAKADAARDAAVASAAADATSKVTTASTSDRARANHTGTQAVSTVDGLQAALDAKVPTSRTVAGKALTADVTLAKTDVGLGNVDNTSDANKLISTATQTALNAKANNTDLTSIADEGTALTRRGVINFVGAGVTATDDSANGRTVVTIPGGGGSSSPGLLTRFRPSVGGYIMTPTINSVAVTPPIGSLITASLILPPGTYDALVVRVTTANASALARMVLYAANPDAATVTTVLGQSAAVPATATGTIICTLDTPAAVGTEGAVVWIGVVNQGTVAAAFAGTTSPAGLPRLNPPDSPDLTANAVGSTITVSDVTGSAVSNPTTQALSNGTAPRVGARRSA